MMPNMLFALYQEVPQLYMCEGGPTTRLTFGAEVTCSGILRKSPEVLGLGLGPVLLDQPSLDLELGIS